MSQCNASHDAERDPQAEVPFEKTHARLADSRRRARNRLQGRFIAAAIVRRIFDQRVHAPVAGGIDQRAPIAARGRLQLFS
jgi:hypothetical protein